MQVQSDDLPKNGVKSRKWRWSVVSWSLADDQREDFP
jgi:hypothetical protein